ncbi:MAG TPA: bifunctional 4-hydroxy-2-oxoglutarate aldolase/2-dehydro-3-deoxy-phosphogluconate aldolase [Jiangellaceae bacterium]
MDKSPTSHALRATMSVTPVIAIVRLPGADHAARVASALHAGGILVIEITLTTGGALEAVGVMRRAGLDGLCVGVGSVRTVDDARRAIDAGAEYLVTPTLNLDVVGAARSSGVPIVCGGLTPTELDAASRAGADYVKLFPASAVGPRYVREVLAPIPDLRIVPTGGVNAGNIGDYRAAGAVGAGIGSALVDRDTVAAEDWDTLEQRATSLVGAWRG